MQIFKIWIIILAFVSSQLAWNLRPFVGDKGLPFELFRARESNFYVAVIQSVGHLFNPEKKADKIPEKDRMANEENKAEAEKIDSVFRFYRVK
jgi:hypothetical protein